MNVRSRKILWISLVSCVTLIFCFICYYIADITSAPLLNVQASDLVGVWEVYYSLARFPSSYVESKCLKEKTQEVREILILKENGFYEQRIEESGRSIYFVKNHRWWLKRTSRSGLWVYLEKGAFYPLLVYEFCTCLSFGEKLAVCEEKANLEKVTMTSNRVTEIIFFNPAEVAILSVWKPLFSREIFLEYSVGDPDAPIMIQLHRLPER